MTWYEATLSCSKMEGRLSTPNTWQEWKQIISGPNKSYWLGNFVFYFIAIFTGDIKWPFNIPILRLRRHAKLSHLT